MAGPSQMVPPHQPQTLGSAEDEALKRNTDCVYFLASPLTCKKGADCEYRHSEAARLNPRDCYYWLNGNCLNPKCSFRHPPLEGMLAPQVPASSGPSLAIPVSNAPHNSSKQAVPCIYFQKGYCLKGDRCHFSHGAAPINTTKAPQVPIANAPFPESSTTKKPFVGLEKCTSEPKIVQKVLIQSKPPSRTVPAKVETVDDYAPEYRQKTPPFVNGDYVSRPNRPQQIISPKDYDTLNSKEADGISREHSPGFDVLVDDDLREADYYRDDYDRRMTPVNDYDIDRPINYKDLDSMVDQEHDIYGDQRRYDSFHRPREQYGRDQRRVSPERRRYPRSNSPVHVDESDIRYRLSKQRKVNGLKSVVSYDVDRESYRGSTRRDSERGISDRLRGRIKLPERERERERGNSRGRLSPGRLQGVRVQDRLKGRVNEEFRGPRAREMYGNNVNFAGPKSLSELRSRKSNENNSNKQEIPLGKRKYSDNSYQQPENDASFEGPKPLSEILKRKRGDNGSREDSKSVDKGVGEVSKLGEEREEGLIVEDDEVAADQENGEAYADEEGEYEYEQAEGEDYIEEEGENVEEGDDYVEDDDGDDFAKKIGVMFS